MKCENSYCVYQSKGKCTLKNIEINALGMCTEVIYVDIDEFVLNKEKNKLLKTFKEDFPLS